MKGVAIRFIGVSRSFDNHPLASFVAVGAGQVQTMTP
jgi:hypothetical protein